MSPHPPGFQSFDGNTNSNEKHHFSTLKRDSLGELLLYSQGMVKFISSQIIAFNGRRAYHDERRRREGPGEIKEELIGAEHHLTHFNVNFNNDGNDILVTKSWGASDG